MKKKAIFISQDIFITDSRFSGGVGLCTNEYIEIIGIKFDLIHFPINTSVKLFDRFLNKIGSKGHVNLAIPKNKVDELLQIVLKNKVEYIFLNHSFISKFAITIKERIQGVKIILCSHGNESGDFLHLMSRYSKSMPMIPRFLRHYKLGLLMSEEVSFRRKYFDLVLTVSEIEESIEKWLGARRVIFLPRVYKVDFIEWEPSQNRVGFISDISHDPNFYSILAFCEEVNRTRLNKVIQLRLIGKFNSRYNYLSSRFDFVEIIGYLSEDEIRSEVGSWRFYLNLVDYFSKGVSTKLAYGMNLGVPVISTQIGTRGYYFPQNTGPIVLESIADVVDYLNINFDDLKILNECRENVKRAVLNFSNMNVVADLLTDI
jgi:hypothetical protein